MVRLPYFTVFLIISVIISVKSQIFRARNTKPQIVFGKMAAKGQFSHQVAAYQLTSKANNKTGGFCGGCLIRDNIVITAGHCGYGNVAGFELRFGSNDLKNMPVIRRTYTFVVHPGYNPSTLENDLTVISMEKVDFSDTIQPIELANTKITPGTLAIVSGFGKTKGMNSVC